jgi:hypothetical protein
LEGGRAYIDVTGRDDADDLVLPGIKDEEEESNVARAEEKSLSGKMLTATIKDADGVCVCVFFLGIIERGTVRKGKGQFTHLHKEGVNKGKVRSYEGEFEDGMFHGKGISWDASGCNYHREFRRGLGGTRDGRTKESGPATSATASVYADRC